jgi:hypothetical protein
MSHRSVASPVHATVGLIPVQSTSTQARCIPTNGRSVRAATDTTACRLGGTSSTRLVVAVEFLGRVQTRLSAVVANDLQDDRTQVFSFPRADPVAVQ